MARSVTIASRRTARAMRAPSLLAILLGLAAIALPTRSLHAAPEACEAGGRILARFDEVERYDAWLRANEWKDLRPFSDSRKRFRIEDGTLRLETRGDSFIVGRALPPPERESVDVMRYLRFEARVVHNPLGARLDDDAKDDSALRVFAVFREKPLQALAYVWSGVLPVGTWEPGRKYFFGDFRQVQRKVVGQGAPPADTWLTVEADLLRDFRDRFDGQAPPHLGGVAFQADSNALPEHSLALLRRIAVYPRSLRECGVREGDRLDGTVVWFR